MSFWKRSVAPVVEMRDAPVPPHACVEHLDADSYCTACGQKFVLRTARDVTGLADADRERLEDAGSIDAAWKVGAL